MENTEIIQKARAKAEMWLNDAYDKATRTEVERLLNASDPTELIDSFYNDLEFGKIFGYLIKRITILVFPRYDISS